MIPIIWLVPAFILGMVIDKIMCTNDLKKIIKELDNHHGTNNDH